MTAMLFQDGFVGCWKQSRLFKQIGVCPFRETNTHTHKQTQSPPRGMSRVPL